MTYRTLLTKQGRLRAALALASSVSLLLARGTAWADPPAGERTPHIDRTPGGTTILPNGRLLTPLGRSVIVPPHPYGMALSPDGGTLAASSNGVGPFALTLLGVGEKGGAPRTITSAQEADFKSTYRGVAFAPDGKTLFVSGGNDGKVHMFDTATGKQKATLSLDAAGVKGSISSDLVVARDGKTLYVADAGNWRLVSLDIATSAVTGSVPTGRIPFAVTLSPDGQRVYVANIGLFEYRTIRGADGKSVTLPFPPFGYPSKAAREGTVIDGKTAPGLGAVNTPESYSVWGYTLSSGKAKPLFQKSTGIPVPPPAKDDGDDDKPGDVVGGSVPCAVVAGQERIYVANANNDTVSVLDAKTGQAVATIRLSDLLPAYLRGLRGLNPSGLTLSLDGARLYVSLSGFNAVAVVDAKRNVPMGMMPVCWYPTRVAVSPEGRHLYVACGKGFGAGPNGGKNFTPGPEGASVGHLMKGALCLLDTPTDADLPALTQRVLTNNGVSPTPPAAHKLPPIKHVVIIVKENRTFDEVFGALPGVRGDASLARYGEPRSVPGIGTEEPVVAMPNHQALARRFAIGDNFCADSDHSADGHRWIVAAPPNVWAESVVSAAYGGQMDDDSQSPAPGRREIFGSNSSATPEDYPEAGTLWHHLARHEIAFANWGEGFEFAGIDEGPGMKPTGSRLPLNVPMPAALFRATSRRYPGFNTNIPDQYRADVFLQEYNDRFESGKEPLPGLLFMHLPNDHGAGPRPKDGYPVVASYMADNDFALGRILERLSRSKDWRDTAVFITEDDAQSGVDSIDAHRSVLLVASPWVKQGYVFRGSADMSAIHHAAFALLGLPPLALDDALASDLADIWTVTPDLTPYSVIAPDKRLFDPARAKDPKDPDYQSARRKPFVPMDDPDEMESLQRTPESP